MRRFAELYDTVDRTRSTNAKVEALVAWFEAASRAEAAWALVFLTGRRPRRLVGASELRDWSCEASGTPRWLWDECRATAGDTAETAALLVEPLHEGDDEDLPLDAWVEERLLPLFDADAEARRQAVLRYWRALPLRERFLLNKLLTGAFRVGVSQTLVIRALSAVSGVERDRLTHRMMGEWEPSAAAFADLISPEPGESDVSRPYPFFLAYPLQREPDALGPRSDWIAEWKWDGIRGQLVKREGQVFLWSRGEELVTDRFPEIAAAAASLPDGTVLDGEILAWEHETPRPFGDLQTRIGRRKVSARLLAEVPVIFMVYDLLEHGGRDVRAEPLEGRRARLGSLDFADVLRLSDPVAAPDWATLAALREGARERRVEGFMLKRRDSAYGTGRRKGDWWKWKVDPLTVDAVLMYAHPGNGRRANLFTDYTFGLWQDGELVPVAKAYTGLSDEEIAEVDRWVRRNTRERFGPVRAVEPVQVFELAFEDVRPSGRHKSGLAVRFPRIARWRRDKPAEEADRLVVLRGMVRG